MPKLVITEKPSVAQSIAKVLSATKRCNGYLEGNGYLISWCVGHLVELAPPDRVNRPSRRHIRYSPSHYSRQHRRHNCTISRFTEYIIFQNKTVPGSSSAENPDTTS